MNIPDNVLNPSLYKKARKMADDSYGKKTSAYKNMFLVKKYKELGGKYSGKKENKGVKRWNEEKWIQVLPFILTGKRVVCGFGANKKACRPSKRIDKNTPPTIQELIKKHGKDKMTELAKMKRKDMSIRIDWIKAKKT
jgi:hypothetical protein